MAKRKLVFVPKAKRLYLFVDGRAVQRFEAWGGPETTVAGAIMDAQQTTPGDYIIHWVGPYVTRTWPWSRIKWGTPLRVAGADVVFEVSPGHWQKTHKLAPELTRDNIAQMHLRLYGELKVPDRWLFNDFGPTAIRYFKDRDGDGRKDANEPLSGEMLHTTPDNEAEHAQGQALRMTESHGCIHLRPLDRDALLAAGGFAPGTPLRILPYHVTVNFQLPGEAAP